MEQNNYHKEVRQIEYKKALIHAKKMKIKLLTEIDGINEKINQLRIKISQRSFKISQYDRNIKFFELQIGIKRDLKDFGVIVIKEEDLLN